MSAHCEKCGCDIVYPEGTWPLGECPRCSVADALRMACRELLRWRDWAQGPTWAYVVPEADVDDVVAEFLGKARGYKAEEGE